jgi:hypothetical protein
MKVNLLYHYYSSYHGAVLCNLNHPDVMRITSAWHNALRRIWNLPYNPHSDLVTALRCRLPLTDELSSYN